MSRVSLRNTLRGNQKTKLPHYPNSVFFSTNNEKRKIYVQRDFLKREQSKPEHKASKRYIEVGMSDLHRTQAAYIPVNRGSHAPPQRIPQGSGEVLERDRGSKSPVSFQPPPRGVNKIYTYDVVFIPGEARKKAQSQT